MSLEQQIETILFYQNEPVSISDLAKFTETTTEAVQDALASLEQNLTHRGIQLLKKDDSVMLGTHPDFSETIEKIQNVERSREIGRAGAETLAIVLYRAPVTRAEIDYIRGVNSTFILRHLLIRGLIERVPNPKDQRGYIYQPTFELLLHLGIRSVDELHDYQTIKNDIAAFMEQQDGEHGD